MNIDERSAGPSCPLLASQSSVSCNFKRCTSLAHSTAFPGASPAADLIGLAHQRRSSVVQGPFGQARAAAPVSCRSRTAHSRLARAPRSAPSLLLPMRPTPPSRVGAPLPARLFLLLAHPAPTPLSPRAGAAQPLSSPLRGSRWPSAPRSRLPCAPRYQLRRSRSSCALRFRLAWAPRCPLCRSCCPCAPRSRQA